MNAQARHLSKFASIRREFQIQEIFLKHARAFITRANPSRRLCRILRRKFDGKIPRRRYTEGKRGSVSTTVHFMTHCTFYLLLFIVSPSRPLFLVFSFCFLVISHRTMELKYRKSNLYSVS